MDGFFVGAIDRNAWRRLHPLKVAIVATGMCAVSQAQVTPVVDLAEPAVIDSGRATFARYCSVGYCHGKDGRAGRGPRFRGRKLDREQVFRSISEGVPKSAMPSWKAVLSDTQIWALIAYIETLSELDPGVPSLSGEESESAWTFERWLPSLFAAPVPPPATDRPTSIAALKRELGWDFATMLVGDPKAGEDLFFRLSDAPNCAACHKRHRRGGEVGPDLSRSATKTARELFRNIVLPDAEVIPEGQLYEMTTTSKERLRVVLSGESKSRIKVYEVSGMPVFRSIKKSDVVAIAPAGWSAMPGTYAKVYDLRELLDIVAFLKSSTDSTASVSLADLR